MQINGSDLNTDILRQQQKIATNAERNIAALRSGQVLTDFEELQLKAAFFKQKETGFLPRLESRLAVALTALYDNETQSRPTSSDISLVYSRTSRLVDETV